MPHSEEEKNNSNKPCTHLLEPVKDSVKQPLINKHITYIIPP